MVALNLIPIKKRRNAAIVCCFCFIKVQRGVSKLSLIIQVKEWNGYWLGLPREASFRFSCTARSRGPSWPRISVVWRLSICSVTERFFAWVGRIWLEWLPLQNWRIWRASSTLSTPVRLRYLVRSVPYRYTLLWTSAQALARLHPGSDLTADLVTRGVPNRSTKL